MNAKEYFVKGYTFLEFKEYKEALTTFEKALKLDPEYVDAWVGKGAALYNLEKYIEALATFEKALKLDQKYVDAWVGKGAALYNLEKYKEALTTFEKAIEIDPCNVAAFYSKATVLFTLKRYNDALKAYDEVITLQPEYVYAWVGKGAALYNLEKYKEALNTFEEALRINPHYDVLSIHLGTLYFILGDHENASKKVDEVLAINNKNTSALVLKGRIKIEEKDYGGAIQCFGEAIRSDLGNYVPLLWSVYTQYLNLESNFDVESREYQEEIGAIIRKLEIINDLYKKYGKRELRMCILYFLGYFYYKSKDIPAAERKLTECAMLKPKREKLKEFFKPKSSTEVQARELLHNIWIYKRPPWWCWWLSSPLYCWTKRVLFVFLLSSISLLLVLHPFIPEWFSIEVNWPVYITFVVFLIFILLSPSIQSIKAEGVGVELHSPSSLEPVLSPVVMETGIKELEEGR